MSLSSLSGDNSSGIMMVKLLLFYIAAVSTMALSNASIRRVRSPAPSAWQGRSSYESSPIGLARSGGGWDNGASTFGRTNGWSGSVGYGANPRSHPNAKSGCSNSNRWDSNVGFSSNTGSAFW